MFKSIFLYLKNIFYKYILKKEIEEDPNIDEDLLRLFTYKNLILPKELKEKLFDTYLYKYTSESKVNELLTSLTFGVKK